MNGIDKAILKAGGQTKLAAALGVTQQSICYWRQRGFVPPSRAVEIEAQFGVHRYFLISKRLRDLVDEPLESLEAVQ